MSKWFSVYRSICVSYVQATYHLCKKLEHLLMLGSAGCSVTAVWQMNKLSLLSTYYDQGANAKYGVKAPARPLSPCFKIQLSATDTRNSGRREWENLWTFPIRSYQCCEIHICRQLLLSSHEFWVCGSSTHFFFLDDKTFASLVVKDTGALQPQVIKKATLEVWQTHCVHVRLETNSPGTSPEILWFFFAPCPGKQRERARKQNILHAFNFLTVSKQKGTHEIGNV